MYWSDKHGPHFHAYYGAHEALISLDASYLSGDLPKRQQRLVSRWFARHRLELAENWERAKKREPLKKIEGLE